MINAPPPSAAARSEDMAEHRRPETIAAAHGVEVDRDFGAMLSFEIDGGAPVGITDSLLHLSVGLDVGRADVDLLATDRDGVSASGTPARSAPSASRRPRRSAPRST